MKKSRGILDIFDKQDDKQIVQIPVDDIKPSRYQPRLRFDIDALNELATSIKETGLIQPITVREVEDGYEIIAGERRYRACIIAGLEEVPSYIMSPTEEQAAQMALVENIQREDLSAIEEAKSYVQIMRQAGLTQEQLAEKIGKSQSAVANKIRLLNLPQEIQNGVMEGKISERHARAILSAPTEYQKRIYKTVLEKKLTVRETEDYIKEATNKQPAKRQQRTKGFTRNLMVAVNTVNESVAMIENLGITVEVETDETAEYIEMILRFPKE